jgi:hypothetical protein
MKAAKFFRYVWRVNAVVIFIAAIGVAAALGTMMLGGVFSGSRSAEPARPAVVKEEEEEQLQLANLTAIAGTNVLQANLTTAGRKGMGSLSSSDYSGGDIRNILTLDTTSGAAKWMFPTHAQVIESRTLEIDASANNDRKPILGVHFVKAIRDRHTDPEGRLVVSDPAATRVVTIAEHINRFEDVTLVNGNAVVVCQRGDHYVLITVDPHTLAKTNERDVAIPKI